LRQRQAGGLVSSSLLKSPPTLPLKKIKKILDYSKAGLHSGGMREKFSGKTITIVWIILQTGILVGLSIASWICLLCE
jgi:hypothetical protein